MRTVTKLIVATSLVGGCGLAAMTEATSQQNTSVDAAITREAAKGTAPFSGDLRLRAAPGRDSPPSSAPGAVSQGASSAPGVGSSPAGQPTLATQSPPSAEIGKTDLVPVIKD